MSNESIPKEKGKLISIKSKNFPRFKQIAQAADTYLEWGWFPIPGRLGSEKAPVKELRDWPKAKRNTEKIKASFAKYGQNDKACNIGLLLGKECIDVDLDSNNSKLLAPRLLPPTFTFGHSGQTTHYLYSMPKGCDPIKTSQYIHSEGYMSIELRGVDTNGNYQYTRASPSLFKKKDGSDELVELIPNNLKPYTIKDENEIRKLVALIAICDIMIHHWVDGQRNKLALGLTGFLIRNNYDQETIEEAIQAICEIAGDDEDRIKEIKGTFKRADNDRRIAGIKLLKQYIDPEIIAKMSNWLNDKKYVDLSEFDIEEIMDLSPIERLPYLSYLREPDLYTVDGMGMKSGGVLRFFAAIESRKELNLRMVKAKKLEGFQYKPNAPVILDRGNAQYWNKYRGTDLLPLRCLKKDIKPFLDLINYLSNHDELIKHALISFMAMTVQSPEKKIKWVPLLIGPEGSGKTTYGRILGHLVGMHNFSEINADALFDNFNEWADSKLVVLINEMEVSNAPTSRGVADKLKSLISDETIRVNNKGIPAYFIDNYTRYIGATNSRTPVKFGMTDRRYYTVESKDLYCTRGTIDRHCAKWLPDGSWECFFDWLKNDGYRKILYFCQNYNVKDIKPHLLPPLPLDQMQEKEHKIFLANAPRYTEEIQDILINLGDIVSFAAIRQNLDNYDQGVSNRLANRQLSQILDFLKIPKVEHSYRDKNTNKVKKLNLRILNTKKYNLKTTRKTDIINLYMEEMEKIENEEDEI